jgi:hypothetical protein
MDFGLTKTTGLYGMRYGFDMDILNSENENEAKLITLDSIMKSFRTSRGANTTVYWL